MLTPASTPNKFTENHRRDAISMDSTGKKSFGHLGAIDPLTRPSNHVQSKGRSEPRHLPAASRCEWNFSILPVDDFPSHRENSSGGFRSHRATPQSSSISNDGIFPNKNRNGYGPPQSWISSDGHASGMRLTSVSRLVRKKTVMDELPATFRRK